MNAHAVIERPGMHTTVQDLGRAWLSAQAVPPSGAADQLSLRAGNRILGNPDASAALEFTLVGPDLRFERDAAVCVVGARCPEAHIAGVGPARSIRPGVPAVVPAGASVRIGPTRGGARGYLCARGGFDTPPILGSRSTLTLVGLGGHAGRTLRAGDRVPLGRDDPAAGVRDPEGIGERTGRWLHGVLSRRVLAVVPGIDADSFGPEGQAALGRPFRVSAQSDRSGIRLDGDAVPMPEACTMLSEGTSVGAVQVVGDGRPIVLGVDGPTTGGYPVIAAVIAADLCILGQVRPRDEIRFEMVSLHEARRRYRSLEDGLTAVAGPAREA